MRCQSGLWIMLGVAALFVDMTSGSRGMGMNTGRMAKDESLILEATTALREAGNYNIIATSLQISADEILPPNASPATFFALSDDALKNLSLPSWLMMDLLHYHTSTDKLLWKTLSTMTAGSCIRTLLYGKNLAVTSVHDRNRSSTSALTINGVHIAHPDIYTRGRLAVHGVGRPFYTFDPNSPNDGLAGLRVTPCSPLHAKYSSSAAYDMSADNADDGSRISWFKAQAVLRSKGYISFSLAIRLEETNLLLERHNLSQITVFAPSDETFAYVTTPSPVLANMVRYHIVPNRLQFGDLIRLPVASKIPTLLRSRHLQINSGYTAFHPLAINNVSILHPDLYSTQELVIHGIFRPFDLVNVTSDADGL